MTEILSKIQTELKAPKGLYNSFGKYHYRSCENILEALKPLLEKYNVALIINDEVVFIGNRFYIKATATLKGEKGEISVSAYAREADTKKGMDESQITGSTSSYARKYALNGLFAIDDTKDADSTNDHSQEQEGIQKPAPKEMLSIEQINDLGDLIELTKTETNQFLNFFKVKTISQVPYDKAKKMLLAKLAKQNTEAI